jgi:protocatechuate 3,4-dioxygenase beta subunit
MARLALLTVGLIALAAGVGTASGAAGACPPTRADSLGPFYEPGAPVRSKVGSGGYVLSGRVRAAGTCRVLRGARIEFWLVNEQGDYDDAHRATVFSRRDGRYRFESNRPIGYDGRPPHIHVRVSLRGFRTLVTQHYPRGSRRSATFSLALRRR